MRQRRALRKVVRANVQRPASVPPPGQQRGDAMVRLSAVPERRPTIAPSTQEDAPHETTHANEQIAGNIDEELEDRQEGLIDDDNEGYDENPEDLFDLDRCLMM